MAPVVAAVVLDELFALGALVVVFELAVPEAVVPAADAALALAVAGFAGCWLAVVVLPEALLVEPAGAGAGAPVGFGVFGAVEGAGVLVLTAGLVAVAVVLAAAPGVFLLTVGEVLALGSVLAAGFEVAALPAVIFVLVAVAVALTGVVAEALPALPVDGEVTAL